jgi:uncharacterized repeat protein (TIGR03803 family)
MTAHRYRPILAPFSQVKTISGVLSIFLATIIQLPAAQAQTFNVIFSFTQNAIGAQPNAGVTLDSHGNVYGTNFFYGVGYGTVYKLTNRNGVWSPTVLYQFQGGMDGANPASRVVFGPDGALYGTTSAGGGDSCRSSGCGTVFKLTPPPTICKTSVCPWTETVLYRFTGGADGAVPEYGDLIFDNNGSIYGTTAGNYASFGSVYKLTNSGGHWTETTLWTFTGGSDGEFPEGGVIFDRAGNLYGSTNTGVFELSPSNGGWTETVIHTFDGMNEGFSSEAGVVFDSAGNLYGSTSIEGPGGAGSIFEMTPSGGSWDLQIIHDGGQLVGTNLTFDAAGNLYGVRTTDRNDNGEAFEMSLIDGSWTYTLLHTFSSGDQGAAPYDGMVMDANGNLWGTASIGGSHNYGLVYEITP